MHKLLQQLLQILLMHAVDAELSASDTLSSATDNVNAILAGDASIDVADPTTDSSIY